MRKLALRALAMMEQERVVHLDRAIALEVTRLSLLLHLSMAASVMLATGRLAEATFWTRDTDFGDTPECPALFNRTQKWHQAIF